MEFFLLTHTVHQTNTRCNMKLPQSGDASVYDSHKDTTFHRTVTQ